MPTQRVRRTPQLRRRAEAIFMSLVLTIVLVVLILAAFGYPHYRTGYTGSPYMPYGLGVVLLIVLIVLLVAGPSTTPVR